MRNLTGIISIAIIGAIALAGCGQKSDSPEFEALQSINSELKVSGTAENYRDAIADAQQAIDQIDDPNRKLVYDAMLAPHRLALDLWMCPDRACEIRQMGLIKEVTDIPIGDPATDDPNLVLDLLWQQAQKSTDGLKEEGLN